MSPSILLETVLLAIGTLVPPGSSVAMEIGGTPAGQTTAAATAVERQDAAAAAQRAAAGDSTARAATPKDGERAASPGVASRSRWRVIGSAVHARPRVVVLSSPERVAARGEPISLSVRDADLVEVVRSLARIAGLNLVLDPSVRGTVTAELEDVPWDQALSVILRMNGFAMELDGRIVTVAPPARLYPIP